MQATAELHERAARVFSALRHRAESDPAATSAFPDDWFDLGSEHYADMGAMFYLASMTPYHRPRSLAAAVASIEPALRLGQYRIFRSQGFPRAFISWAGLDPVRERRFAIDHAALLPEDWNSGPSVWLVDFVAPFGHMDEIVAELPKNQELTRLRALWHDRKGEGYRVIEWTRQLPGGVVRQRSFSPAAFARHLERG
ncbi:MAG: toxin-activating lysine-acyltransferase [Defluviimonas sp.]|uniref:toxin-activating lysine-acyltransferase n=1 Tax=Albidovulum sp. TaxID=1872424 RepID=UPI002A2A0B23|nr:toxin-activating lysine-acyltransferase [Defluviimonas sp.]